MANCEWIRRQQNLIITGPARVGKTWLGCAFGTQACRSSPAVTYDRAVSLFGDIATTLAEGSLASLKAKLIKPAVLIIDDLGNGELTLQGGHVLLDVVEQRMRTGSLILISPYPREAWRGFFPDPNLADAWLDRVVHQAHRTDLKGDSSANSTRSGWHNADRDAGPVNCIVGKMIATTGLAAYGVGHTPTAYVV